MTRSRKDGRPSVWCEHEDYVMRSLAEMRVAKILTRLNITWVYEHMPYEFHGYLPDFYLPHLDAFVEVKGERPTDEELAKCQRLHDETGRSVVLAYGEPNVFIHRPEAGAPVRPEVGWLPYLFINGKQTRIPCNRICQAIYAIEGSGEGMRYVSAFNVSKFPMAMHIRSCMVEMSHQADPKSKAIYRHNGPLNEARLNSLSEPSDNERYLIGFIAERERAREAWA